MPVKKQSMSVELELDGELLTAVHNQQERLTSELGQPIAVESVVRQFCIHGAWHVGALVPMLAAKP